MSAFAAQAAGEGPAEPILGPCEVTPLEIASGLVFGFTPKLGEPAAAENGNPTALAALESAILPALRRPPCLMSFSGGTASSAILAVAVQLARREGLELPVAATIRIDGSPGAHEAAWQEHVIIRLGLTDWIRLEFADELDLVGPVAMRVLRRHSILWPSHAHAWMPLIEWASGGSLITGLGQRNALGEPSGLFCRNPGPLPWLTSAAQREVRAHWSADAASRPRTERRTWWWARLRQVQIKIDLLRRLGDEVRAEICHPLIDEAFTSALSQFPAHRGATNVVLGDLLPGELLARPTTPTREDRFWRGHSRELAEGWQGEGVDPDLVDAEALRMQWSSPRPDPRTFLLLQSIALAREVPTVVPVVASAPAGLETGEPESACHPAKA
jgi:hypothetical protein